MLRALVQSIARWCGVTVIRRQHGALPCERQATPADRLALSHKLTDLGYEIATDGPDTTAWLQS